MLHLQRQYANTISSFAFTDGEVHLKLSFNLLIGILFENLETNCTSNPTIGTSPRKFHTDIQRNNITIETTVWKSLKAMQMKWKSREI